MLLAQSIPRSFLLLVIALLVLTFSSFTFGQGVIYSPLVKPNKNGIQWIFVTTTVNGGTPRRQIWVIQNCTTDSVLEGYTCLVKISTNDGNRSTTERQFLSHYATLPGLAPLYLVEERVVNVSITNTVVNVYDYEYSPTMTWYNPTYRSSTSTLATAIKPEFCNRMNKIDYTRTSLTLTGTYTNLRSQVLSVPNGNFQNVTHVKLLQRIGVEGTNKMVQEEFWISEKGIIVQYMDDTGTVWRLERTTSA